MSRVRGTIGDPSACRRSLCGQMLRKVGSPLATAAFQQAMGHSHKRSVTACPFWTASSRSRIFGTAFRSLTTTLAPPLRGLCSWPAPSNPCRISSRNRSIPSSSAPFGFEAEPGRRQCPEPVFRADLQRSRIFPDLHSPSGPLTTTFRIKAFNRFPYREARLTKRSIAPHSPQLLFRYASDRRSELASSSLTYRSVNPGTESMIIKAASPVKQNEC
jgi:hypothetical protein